MKNFYKTLEVREDASPEVIAKAYKALCAKYHPDKYSAQKRRWAIQRMQELNHAYSILSDSAKRSAYDRKKKREVIQVFWEEGLIGLTRLWLNR